MCVRLRADYGKEVAPCLRFKHGHLTCPPRLTVLGKLAFQSYDEDTGEKQEGTEVPSDSPLLPSAYVGTGGRKLRAHGGDACPRPGTWTVWTWLPWLRPGCPKCQSDAVSLLLLHTSLHTRLIYSYCRAFLNPTALLH